MVMGFNIERLRAGTPAEQSTVLKAALTETPGISRSQLTDILISHVKEGSISPSVIQIWLGVARSPVVAVDIIHKCRGSLAWQYGIKSLFKYVCNEATFKSTWNSIGGAQGLVSLMAELSLKDVRALCKAIQKTANSGPDNSPLRAERQEHISELLQLLWSKDKNPDQRPLRSVYARIAPACTPVVAQEWAIKIEQREVEDATGAVIRGIREAHWDVFKQTSLEKAFLDNERLHLESLKPFCDRDFDFLLTVVQNLAELDSLRGLPSNEFLTFVAPFARRASKLKQHLAQFWTLINECLRKHDSLRVQILPHKALWHSPAGLISPALMAWRHDSNSGYGDAHLAALIGLIDKSKCTLYLLVELISVVSPSMRYPLARLFFKHGVAYQFDLGPPSHTESAMLSGVRLPTALLQKLPGIEALTLFERWLEANPDLKFIHGYGSDGSSLMSDYLDPELNIEDVHIIRALLIRQAQGSDMILPIDPSAVLETLRTEELERRKREAMRGQDSEKRGFYARSALTLSIALGDVRLMTETLIWCRRFLKDSLAVRQIANHAWSGSNEVRHLVSALGMLHANTEDVLAAVCQANEFLLSFLETASLAVLEPSFEPLIWERSAEMITTTASDRLARINGLQDRLNLSDDEVYDAVLKPTLDLIIAAESQILKAENEGLYPGQRFNDIHVPSSTLWETRQPALRFLDAVAKARDDMWLKARVEQNPAVFTLQKPWPRGLTLECLTRDEDGGLQYEALNVPYIEKRAEAIVFCDPEFLLAPFPEDEETQLAVSIFLEDWSNALQLWTSQGNRTHSREDRVRRAWNYALDELSRDRMTREEAERFWRPIFEEAGIETYLLGIGQSMDDRLPAELPQQPGVPGQPEEWDPDPRLDNVSRKVSKKRALSEATCLDRMLDERNQSSKRHRRTEWRSANVLGEDFEIPIVPASEPPKEFWQLLPPRRSSLAHSYVDAFVAAAVLSLNSTYGSESALLKKPFPNTSDWRFPAVYLEEEFLERTGKSHDGALKILTRLNKHVPPKLLETLASSILERIESEKSVAQAPYEVFTKVVKLLSRSNEPSLAIPLISRFVLDFPNASSWHRAVLNKGTLTPLDHQAIESFFSSLCTSFSERLSYKSKKQPFLKITTIKMILELLGNTEYVGPAFSFDIIARKLLRHANHVDARVKALSSLLEIYKEDPTSEALAVLRKYAVPMAASLNERLKPMTEEDWKAIENSDAKLPEVTVRSEATPVVDLLQSNQNPYEFEEIADLAYEAQRLSITENARWIKLFLKRNGFALTSESLDILCSIPKFPWLISHTFRCSSDTKVPRDLFQAVARHHLFCLHLPQDIVAINEVLRKTPNYSISNSSVRWLELTEPPNHFLDRTRTWAASALDRFDSHADVMTDIPVTTLADLEEYLIEISKAYIAKADLSSFDSIINSLPIEPNHETCGIATEKGGGKVLSYLTRYVDSLRTPAWQSNTSRQPEALPPSFSLHLRSISYGRDSPLEKLPLFIDRVVAIISSIVGSGKPYHSDYLLLERKVCTNLAHVYLAGARLLGSPDNFPDPGKATLLEHLRVQMACAVLNPSLNSHALREDEEAQKLVRGWKESSVEEFRDLARNLRFPLWD
ncbi:unnamed protein product [Clonostachys rosea]|uniref:Nucleolar pre-ribosomal-associated protein 1 C-terminal domain-containing protein n=1 Tax=Bionectria ochroleuca TaxID=29856 RepID=A0ABY6UR21_BIOOC|nr:unnamed protein product [Clonostachys rosea]